MIIKNLVISDTEPKAQNVVWAKPVGSYFELYFFYNGQWKKGAPDDLVVTNVEGLTKEQLDSLKPGDYVIKETGNEYHTYWVSYKDEVKGELSLTYADHQNVEEVYYEKTAGVWGHVITEITPISKFAQVGSVQDDKNANTVNGAKAFATDNFSALLGTDGDSWAEGDLTLYGLKKYIDNKTST